jgi:hypothetical protein
MWTEIKDNGALSGSSTAEDTRKFNGFEISLSTMRFEARARIESGEALFSPGEIRHLVQWVALTMAQGHEDFHTRESLNHRADAIGTLLYALKAKPEDRRYSVAVALDKLDRAFE